MGNMLHQYRGQLLREVFMIYCILKARQILTMELVFLLKGTLVQEKASMEHHLSLIIIVPIRGLTSVGMRNLAIFENLS